jgi:hypothetical protein
VERQYIDGRGSGGALCCSDSDSLIGVCRAHWLLTLRRLWEAERSPRAKATAAKWLKHRCFLEQVFDTISLEMLETHGAAWAP